MSNRHELGSYYEYVVADVTGHLSSDGGPLSPVQDSRIPMYLGLGPEVPGDTFVCADRGYRNLGVLEPGDPLNPFVTPLVLARREV